MTLEEAHAAAVVRYEDNPDIEVCELPIDREPDDEWPLPVVERVEGGHWVLAAIWIGDYR